MSAKSKRGRRRGGNDRFRRDMGFDKHVQQAVNQSQNQKAMLAAQQQQIESARQLGRQGKVPRVCPKCGWHILIYAFSDQPWADEKPESVEKIAIYIEPPMTRVDPSVVFCWKCESWHALNIMCFDDQSRPEYWEKLPENERQNYVMPEKPEEKGKIIQP